MENQSEGSKLNIALIGCGRISNNHIKSILLHKDDLQLVAICDNDKNNLEKAQSLIKELEADSHSEKSLPNVFLNYEEFLSEVSNKSIKIDLVVIATPSGFHAKQVIQAAKAGLNICTEKPMATNLADALKMVEICEKNKVNLFVVKQNRCNKTLQLVKKQIDAGRFGDLVMLTVNVFWQRPQSYYDLADWRGTKKLDGGALMNQASHYVDLLEWFGGPVKYVSASTATMSRKIESEDTATLQLTWENGALGTMAVTMLTYPENLEGSITILGKKGTVKIGGKAVNKIEKWSFEDKSIDDEKIDEVSYETTSVYGFGHPAFYEDMISSLKGEKESICSGKEGLKSIQILEAAYLSAENGLRIELPLNQKI